MAGGYDGEIRIRTLIENGDASSSLLQLESRFQKTAREAHKLTDGMREIEQRKIPTEEYKNLQKELSLVDKEICNVIKKSGEMKAVVPTEEYVQYEKQLSSAEKKLEQLYGKERKYNELGASSKQWDSLNYEIENTKMSINAAKAAMADLVKTGDDKRLSESFEKNNEKAIQLGEKMRDIKAQMRSMEESGTAYVDPKSTAEYQQKAERLRDVNSQMEILNQRMNEAADREARAGDTGEQSLGKTQKAAHKAAVAIAGLILMASKIKNVLSVVGGVTKNALSTVSSAAKKAFNSIFNHAKKSGGIIEKFGKRVKKIALTILVFQWVSKAFRAMIDSIQSGIQNYAKYSGDFNQKMSELKSSATNLKNAIGAAAVPIVSALAPALTTLCNWITKAVNLLNQLFSALSGKGTWSKAKNQQVDYAKSLNGTANAAKKAKGALQGFDELNVISSNDSGSGSGGNGTTGVSYEEMPISDNIKKIKDILAGEDWTELGKIIADKLNNAMKSIPWDSIQAEAEKTGKRIGTLINGFVSEFDWNLLGYTLAQGINTALIFLNTFLETVDWTKLGSGLATGINGLVDNLDWSLLGTTISNGFNMAIDTFYGFVSTLDWAKLGSNIGESIQTALSNIHWENVGKGLSDGIIGLLTMLTNAIYEIDWQELGDDVATVLENIDWSGIADALFEAIGAALGGLAAFLVGLIGDAWDKLVDWWYDTAFEDGEFTIAGLLEGIGKALSNIGTWIYEHIFEPFIKGFKNAFGIHSPSTVMAEMGGYIIEGLRNGLTGIWDRVSDIIEKFKDNMKKSFTDVKDNVINTLDNMKEKVQNIFKNMWDGVKNVINTMLGGVEKMVNSVINGLNSMIESMNQLSWDIPDWVPKIGGNKFGLNIPTISNVSIPRLANGGITTGSTLANIGEAGREAVLPLENNLSYMKPLAEMIASEMKGVQTVRIVADEGKIFKIVREEANDYYRRTGSPAFDF